MLRKDVIVTSLVIVGAWERRQPEIVIIPWKRKSFIISYFIQFVFRSTNGFSEEEKTQFMRTVFLEGHQIAAGLGLAVGTRRFPFFFAKIIFPFLDVDALALL